MQIPKIEPKCEYCNHFKQGIHKVSCDTCIHNLSHQSNFDPDPKLEEAFKREWYLRQLEPRYHGMKGLREYSLHELELIYMVVLEMK